MSDSGKSDLQEAQVILGAVRNMEVTLQNERVRASGLEAELLELRQRSSAATESASTEVRNLREELALVTATRVKLAEQVAALSASLEAAKAELQRIRESGANLWNRAERERETFRKGMLGEQARREQLEGAFQRFQAQSQASFAELSTQHDAALERERTEQQRMAHVLETERRSGEEVRGALTLLKARLAQAETARMAAVEDSGKSLHAALELEKELKGSLASARGEVETARQELRRIAEQTAKSAAERKEEKRDHERLAQALEEERRRGEEARAEQARIKALLDRAEAARDAALADAGKSLESAHELEQELRRSLASAREAANTAHQEFLRVSEEQDEYRAAVEVAADQARARTGELEHRIQSGSKLVGDLAEKVGATDGELQRLNQELVRLQTEKKLLQSANFLLKSEADRLRGVYPLKDLVALKDRDIARVRRELAEIPADHPRRGEIDEVLSALLEQREHVGNLLREAEQRPHQ